MRRQSAVGQLVDNALVVEKESLPELSPILRVYEGCVRALLGEIEEANLVKLHRFSGKVTYLVCAAAKLDPEPGPHIKHRIKLSDNSSTASNYTNDYPSNRVSISKRLRLGSPL